MALKTVFHDVEFCVVGGGLAGMGAAISAARHGIKTLLMHERPVPGGNASSEIRMWVCGSKLMLETGLIEELRLENRYRNNTANYSIWDSITYEMVAMQENLAVLFNCSCQDAETDGNKIVSVTGYQQTTQQYHKVRAKFFADCSGDSILAPLTGAKFRIGREAKSEFGETLAQDQQDKHTMGMSCLLQAREMSTPQKFIPPSWAYSYPTEDSLPPRGHRMGRTQNFWWVELGGMNDSIADTETLRDELLKTMFGIWDHMKNHGDHGVENFAVDWVGFLPGKRESRRYTGDHILNEKDILSGGNFHDTVAYGGWPIDDHHPAGFLHNGAPNINIVLEKNYTIPLRSLYSCNIENLLFAGRNISATHTALSSTRVMATCMLLGQAVGTAVSVAVKKDKTIRQTAQEDYAEIQQLLLEDDCTLPGLRRNIAPEVKSATLSSNCGNPEVLRNGIDRDYPGEENFWSGKLGDRVTYEYPEYRNFSTIRLVFDSDLARLKDNGHLNLPANYFLNAPGQTPPETLMKSFAIYADGKEVYRTDENHQRLVRINIPFTAKSVEFRPMDADSKKLFAFEVR